MNKKKQNKTQHELQNEATTQNANNPSQDSIPQKSTSNPTKTNTLLAIIFITTLGLVAGGLAGLIVYLGDTLFNTDNTSINTLTSSIISTLNVTETNSSTSQNPSSQTTSPSTPVVLNPPITTNSIFQNVNLGYSIEQVVEYQNFFAPARSSTHSQVPELTQEVPFPNSSTIEPAPIMAFHSDDLDWTYALLQEQVDINGVTSNILYSFNSSKQLYRIYISPINKNPIDPQDYMRQQSLYLTEVEENTRHGTHHRLDAKWYNNTFINDTDLYGLALRSGHFYSVFKWDLPNYQQIGVSAIPNLTNKTANVGIEYIDNSIKPAT